MKATKITEVDELNIIDYYIKSTARATTKYFHIRLNRLNDILQKHNIEHHNIIKTTLTDADILFIINNYSNMSDNEICKQFHITKSRLFAILQENNIIKHTEEFNRHIVQENIVNDEAAVIKYYSANNLIATARKFHTNKEQIIAILTKNNISLHNKSTIAKIKSKNQSCGLKKFYQNNPEAAHRSCGKTTYIYNGIKFDSSWELAVWIFAIDHKIPISRVVDGFEYYVNNKKHYYFPDFNYNNKIIEIKGDHMLNANNELIKLWSMTDREKIIAKQECIKRNKVEIWPYEKVKFALDYVLQTYGNNYLKQFKLKTNKRK